MFLNLKIIHEDMFINTPLFIRFLDPATHIIGEVIRSMTRDITKSKTELSTHKITSIVDLYE